MTGEREAAEFLLLLARNVVLAVVVLYGASRIVSLARYVWWRAR